MQVSSLVTTPVNAIISGGRAVVAGVGYLGGRTVTAITAIAGHLWNAVTVAGNFFASLGRAGLGFCSNHPYLVGACVLALSAYGAYNYRQWLPVAGQQETLVAAAPTTLVVEPDSAAAPSTVAPATVVATTGGAASAAVPPKAAAAAGTAKKA